jgi:choline dehydrogenase-like flavoprotein
MPWWTPKGRVFGVRRLRVVGASAFPFSIPEYSRAIMYMLAERIADEI